MTKYEKEARQRRAVAGLLALDHLDFIRMVRPEVIEAAAKFLEKEGKLPPDPNPPTEEDFKFLAGMIKTRIVHELREAGFAEVQVSFAFCSTPAVYFLDVMTPGKPTVAYWPETCELQVRGEGDAFTFDGSTGHAIQFIKEKWQAA